MKNSLMTMVDKILLRKRSVIETVNDELKNNYQVEGNPGIITYSFLPKNPSFKYSAVKDGQ